MGEIQTVKPNTLIATVDGYSHEYSPFCHVHNPLCTFRKGTGNMFLATLLIMSISAL